MNSARLLIFCIISVFVLKSEASVEQYMALTESEVVQIQRLQQLQQKQQTSGSSAISDASIDLILFGLMIQAFDLIGHEKYKSTTIKRSHSLENMVIENPELASRYLEKTTRSLLEIYTNAHPNHRQQAIEQVLTEALQWQPSELSLHLSQGLAGLEKHHLLTKVFFVLSSSIGMTGLNAYSTPSVIYEKISYLMRLSKRAATYGALSNTDFLWQTYLEFVSRISSLDDLEGQGSKIKDVKFQKVLEKLDQVTIEYFISDVENRIITQRFRELLELLASLKAREWAVVYQNISLNQIQIPAVNGATILNTHWISQQNLVNKYEAYAERVRAELYYKRFWRFVGDMAVSLMQPSRTSLIDWLFAPLDFFYRSSGSDSRSLVAWGRGFQFSNYQLELVQSAIAEERVEKCQTFLNRVQLTSDRLK